MSIWRLLKLDFWRYVKNKKMFIVITVMPIIALLCTVLFINCISNVSNSKLNVGVLNEDNNKDMDLIVNIANQSPSVKENVNLIQYIDFKTMKRHVGNKELHCAIKIPRGFIQNIYNNNEGQVEFYNAENPGIKVIALRSMVNDFVKLGNYMRESLENLWQSMDDLHISNKEKISVYNKTAEKLIVSMLARDNMFQYKSSITLVTYYLVYFVVIFMYINFFSMYRNITCEDEQAIIERLKLYNCTESKYIFSKCFICFTIQMLVNVIILGVPLYILKVKLIYILINVLLITLFNGIVVFTVIKMFHKVKCFFLDANFFVVFIILSSGYEKINPLKISANAILNFLKGKAMLQYYHNIFNAILFMAIINVLFEGCKKILESLRKV